MQNGYSYTTGAVRDTPAEHMLELSQFQLLSAGAWVWAKPGMHGSCISDQVKKYH